MLTIETIRDVENLINNQTEENIHLDYKQSDALLAGNLDRIKTELAKDVSAFANSDGGQIIYGVVEQNHVPTMIDNGIADQGSITKEWIEQVIVSRVTPGIEGLRILRISKGTGNSLFVITIPKSFRGPHQVTMEHRYYKRANFKSAPMEHYEIQDVAGRIRVAPPLLVARLQFQQRELLQLVIENVSNTMAKDVRFKLSPELREWFEKKYEGLGCSVTSLGLVLGRNSSTIRMCSSSWLTESRLGPTCRHSRGNSSSKSGTNIKTQAKHYRIDSISTWMICMKLRRVPRKQKNS